MKSSDLSALLGFDAVLDAVFAALVRVAARLSDEVFIKIFL